jgi:hypothetical protein
MSWWIIVPFDPQTGHLMMDGAVALMWGVRAFLLDPLREL